MKRLMSHLILPAVMSVVAMVCVAQSSLHELRQLADEGDPAALYRLAYLYDIGTDSIPVDTVMSTALYTLSAEKGYAPAQNYLGFRYYRGEGVERDTQRALMWIQRAADQGDPRGYNNLGWMLLHSEDVEHDYAKAAFWFGKAAEAGVSSAMSQLGDLYRDGTGVPVDTLRADSLYTEAIAHGLRDAELRLIDLNGERYEALDSVQARELGKDYYRMGAPRVAVTLFDIAAHKGDPQGMTLLADALSRGMGVSYDYEKSIELYLRAAELGDPSAAFVIAELLEMFPDALDGYGNHTDLKDFKPASAPSNDPQYWYGIAASGGVTTAEAATRRLYSK